MQREYDEKKTIFVENIFTNIAFRTDLSPDAAYSLLNVVDRLTYRQFCLLALLLRPEDFGIDPNGLRLGLQSTRYQNNHTMFLRQELAELERYGFFDDSRGDATAYLSTMGIIACELMGSIRCLQRTFVESARTCRDRLGVAERVQRTTT